jgi:hypothetical protein
MAGKKGMKWSTDKLREKTHHKSLRLTDIEIKAIHKVAKKHRISFARMLRHLVLKGLINDSRNKKQTNQIK